MDNLINNNDLTKLTKVSMSNAVKLVNPLYRDYMNKNLILNPKYQRGYIWDKQMQEELIVSILRGFPIGNIILRNKGDKNEVVDGQQRLRTIFRFIGEKNSDQLIITGQRANLVKQLIKSLPNLYPTLLNDEEKKIIHFQSIKKVNRITYSDLKEVSLIKDMFESKEIPMIIFDSITSDETIVSYFAKIQNQEKLLAGELIGAMPSTIVDLYFSNAEETINKFSKLISINNDRKVVEKIIFSIIGLFDNDKKFNKINLPLNSTDKQIMKYIKSKTYEQQGQISDDLKKEIIKPLFESLSKFINCNINFENIEIYGKRRFIKFFLLALLFSDKLATQDEFVNIFINVVEISNACKILNQNTINELEKWEKITKITNKKLTKEREDIIKSLFILSTGQQNYEIVKSTFERFNKNY